MIKYFLIALVSLFLAGCDVVQEPMTDASGDWIVRGEETTTPMGAYNFCRREPQHEMCINSKYKR